MYSIDLERNRDAKFLYALYKNLRNQIKDEEVKPDKIYEIKIKGDWLLMMVIKARKKFEQSRKTVNLLKY